jgi:tetratricopeptide (TPR) repeat protein
MTVKMEQRRERWVLDALLWVMVAAIVAFFILGRYRQPLVPLAILFASTGLHDLYWRFRNRNWIAIRIRVVVTIVALIVCNLPVHDESMLRASSYMNMGIAAGQAGNLGVSIPALYRAIESHPEMVEAYVNLGKAMEMSNRPEDAITCYEAALEIEPTLIMADAALGQVHARLGDRTRAIYHLERAIQIDPSDFQSKQLLSTLKDQ